MAVARLARQDPAASEELDEPDLLAGLEIPTRRTGMASSSKRKTTMAKLNRERRLAERRLEKQAKKDARKRAAAEQANPAGDA
jgi:hypothetical protein